MVQEAHEWLQGGKCAREGEEVLERALARGLQLLSARLQLGGLPAPLQAGALIAPWAAIAPDEGEPDEDSSATLRCPVTPCPDFLSLFPCHKNAPAVVFPSLFPSSSKDRSSCGQSGDHHVSCRHELSAWMVTSCLLRGDREGAKNGAGRPAMHRDAAKEATNEPDWKEAATEAALAAVQDILGTPGPKEVTAAVRAQLEQGNVVRSPALSHALHSTARVKRENLHVGLQHAPKLVPVCNGTAILYFRLSPMS